MAEGLERLGDTTTFRSALIDLLAIDGWTLTITAAEFGEAAAGVLRFTLRKDHLTVVREGRSLLNVACALFEQAMSVQGHARQAA